MNNVILAYDAGTSGVKASVMGLKGKVIDAETENYDTHYAPGGIAEQNPHDWWRAVISATKALTERNPDLKTSVAAIGVSGHMLGCLPVDTDGEPLHPCMIHSDSRAEAQRKKIDEQIGAGVLYEMSGNILDARSSLTKQLWVKEELPDIYEETSKFLQCKDFITSRLTGNINNTDYSDAGHGELMDITNKRYNKDIFSQLHLDIEKQPQLKKSCDIAGHLTKSAAKLLGLTEGVPVIVGGGDGACGSAGAGNILPGDAFLSLGSTGWIARISEKPIIDPEQRIFNIPNLDGRTSSVYGVMQSAGSSINWVKRLIGAANYDAFNDMAALVSPGCDGLVYLPYLDGERSPVFDYKASGVFAGMSMSQSHAHFARAAFEGVAYALRQIADIMREYGAMDEIRIIGGGAKSRVFPQIIADITRLKLKTLNVPHENAAAIGIASAAAVGAGIYEDIEEALSFIKEDKEIIPESQPVEAYEETYKKYLKLYPALKEVMHM